MHKSVFCNLMCSQFRLIIFWQRKMARNMLLKLTPNCLLLRRAADRQHETYLYCCTNVPLPKFKRTKFRLNRGFQLVGSREVGTPSVSDHFIEVHIFLLIKINSILAIFIRCSIVLMNISCQVVKKFHKKIDNHCFLTSCKLN